MKNDLVQNIKDCGQSLIDNAEKIVGGLPMYTKNLSLTCYPAEKDEPIYINASFDFCPKKFIERVKYGESED